MEYIRTSDGPYMEDGVTLPCKKWRTWGNLEYLWVMACHSGGRSTGVAPCLEFHMWLFRHSLVWIISVVSEYPHLLGPTS